MSKLVGSILAIAAAIVVNVIPGVGQFLSAAIGSTLATSVVAGVTAFGLQAGLRLLGIGPSAGKPETAETSIKTSRPPRVSAYGRSRLYGAVVLYETSTSGVGVDVYAVHDGEMDGIETRYLNDDRITLAGSFVQPGGDGRYKGNTVNFYSTSGVAPGAGLPAVATLLGPSIWTSSHRGDGVVALAVTARPVKGEDFQEVYPTGTVPVPSIVARWQRCPILTPDYPGGGSFVWTENPVHQLLHYLLLREGPKSALALSDPGWVADMLPKRQIWWAKNIKPTLAFWTAAAAICDQDIPLKAGGTEKRYRSNVSHRHTDENKAVKAAFLATFDGWLCRRNDGALIIYAGQYSTPGPDDSIGPNEIVSYTFETGGIDNDAAVNEIVCSYVSADHDYNMVDADPWRDESDIASRGTVLSQSFAPAVPSHGQVRRLAKRIMARTNAINRGTITTNLAGRKIQFKRYISLNITEAGVTFYSGPAEIISLVRNVTGGVTFEWVAADANVDNWNPAADEGDPAAIGNRVPQTPLTTPTISATSVSFYSGGARILVEGSGPDRTDLTWYLHWRIAGATLWSADEEYPDTATGPSVEIITGLVPEGEDIEIQIAYQVGDGRFSAWSATTTVDTTEGP